MTKLPKGAYIGAVAAGLALGLVFGLGRILPTPMIKITWEHRSSDDSSFRPAAPTEGGEEVVLVYLGAASCGWSNIDGLPDAVRRIRDHWYALTRGEAGTGFATVGIARDVNIDAGIEHLAKYGPFDEAVVGRGWLNVGFFKYVYGEMPGPAATPQVLVVQRTVHRTGGQTWISDERVLRRFVGADEIMQWHRGEVDSARLSGPDLEHRTRESGPDLYEYGSHLTPGLAEVKGPSGWTTAMAPAIRSCPSFSYS